MEKKKFRKKTSGGSDWGIEVTALPSEGREIKIELEGRRPSYHENP